MSDTSAELLCVPYSKARRKCRRYSGHDAHAHDQLVLCAHQKCFECCPL